MAIYLLSVKALSRTKGRNVIAAAAYRAGEKLRDAVDFFSKKSKEHDYTKRCGVIDSGVVLPRNAPQELSDRATLWNTVERYEKRKDSRVAREVLIALPHELSAEERQAATLELVNHLVDTYGVGADYAIHEPDKHPKADQRNHHAHILITTRSIDANGLSPKVIAAFNDKATGGETIEAIREAWEGICNNALEAAQRPERVCRHTLQAQGIERLPEPKQGAIATQMEREGKTSHAGEERRAVKEFNEMLAHIPDDDEPEEPDEDEAPVNRKREVTETQAAMKDARKQDRHVANLLYRRGLELMRRLQQQRRRRQEQLRRRMQLLTRSMLMNTWRKHAAGSNANQGGNNQAQAPPNSTATGAEYNAEMMAALLAKGFEMD